MKRSPFTNIEFAYCLEKSRKLFSHDLAFLFREKVDETLYPNYRKVVNRPMDLRQVVEKLEKREYRNSGEWVDDIKLIWSNARIFNSKQETIKNMVNVLEQKADKYIKYIPKTEMDLWFMKLEKISKNVDEAIQKRCKSSERSSIQ